MGVFCSLNQVSCLLSLRKQPHSLSKPLWRPRDSLTRSFNRGTPKGSPNSKDLPPPGTHSTRVEQFSACSHPTLDSAAGTASCLVINHKASVLWCGSRTAGESELGGGLQN